jgi:hypothetical protein
MAARLGLAANVGDWAKELYWKMDKPKAWPHGPGWSKDRIKGPLAYAACLSIAGRADGSPLSLRELVQAVAADGDAAATKDINRFIKHIRKQLGEELAGQSTGVGMAFVSAFVRRFGALVGLREAESAEARRLEKGIIDVRNNVDIVAAAVICMQHGPPARRRQKARRQGRVCGHRRPRF